MPTPPLCPPGSRDALFAAHRVVSPTSPAFGGTPYLRSMDVGALQRHGSYNFAGAGTGLPGTSSAIEQVLVSPDGDYILCVQASSAIIRANRGDTWEALPAGNALVALPAAADATCYKAALRLSPDHQYLYMPGPMGSALNLYKVPEMAAVTGLPAVSPNSGVHGNGCWSPDGTKLATIHFSSPFFTVRNWPALTTPVATKVFGAAAGYQDVAFSADGSKLCVAHSTANLSGVWDVATMTHIVGNLPVGACHRVELTPDGLYWMLASLTTGNLYFVSTTTHALVADVGIPSPMFAMADAKFSSDGKYLLLIVAGYVGVYDWATKAQLTNFAAAGGSGLFCADCGPMGHSISNADTTPVADSEGNPIEGVVVTVHHKASGEMCGYATTDVDGRYVAPVPTTAPHTVLFKGPLSNEASVVVDWVIPT